MGNPNKKWMRFDCVIDLLEERSHPLEVRLEEDKGNPGMAIANVMVAVKLEVLKELMHYLFDNHDELTAYGAVERVEE